MEQMRGKQVRVPRLPVAWVVAIGLASLASAVPGRLVQAQRIDAYLSADSVTVGERFTLTLVVEHDFGVEPVFPAGDAGVEVFGDLEVIQRQARAGRYLGTPQVGGTRIDSVVYEVTTFALDTAFVPALPVRFLVETDTLAVASVPQVLPVISLVPPDATEIRDLKPLADFPRAIWPWILLALVVLVLAGTWFYYWRRRPPEDAAPPPPPPPTVSAYDFALQRLRSLEETADLFDPAQTKPFYVELSEIVRQYISRRLRIAAMESTTGEVLVDLEQRTRRYGIASEATERARRVLELSDLVKFADIQPDPAEGRRGLLEAEAFLEIVEQALNPPPRKPVPAETTA